MSTPNIGDDRRCATLANQSRSSGRDQENGQHDGVVQNPWLNRSRTAHRFWLPTNGELAGTTGLEEGLRPVGLRRGWRDHKGHQLARQEGEHAMSTPRASAA